MPYERAKNWTDTQSDIGKILRKHGIGDVQWSVSDTASKMALSFVKKSGGSGHYVGNRWIKEAPRQQIVVRLTLPLKPEGQERNIAFRVLYWYLKSKLEAIAYSFNDGTEFFNFEREFFGNVVIEDAHGQPTEAFDAFKRGNVELAPAERVIALAGGSS
jgi:hypothetical protein